MNREFRVIRSRRRTLAIEITRDAAILVRSPLHVSDAAIFAFVRDHEDWISSHLQMQQQRLLRHPEPTEAERQELLQNAKTILPQRVSHYAALMGVTPTGLRITNAKGRFGSCSPKNSLCFSLQLMQYDDAAIDYVVVHELAHILHKNHGAAFYKTIAAILPDYKARIRLLKDR